MSQGQAHPPVGRTQAQRWDQEEQAHGKERPWIPQGPTKNDVTLILLLCCQEIPRAVLFSLLKPHYRANFTLRTDLRTIYCLKATWTGNFITRKVRSSSSCELFCQMVQYSDHHFILIWQPSSTLKEPVCSQKLDQVISWNLAPKELKLVRKSTLQPDWSTKKVQRPTQHSHL